MSNFTLPPPAPPKWIALTNEPSKPDILERIITNEPTVTCSVCGKQILIKKDNRFFVVAGNIYHGIETRTLKPEMVIGDNFNRVDQTLCRSIVYCDNCFHKTLFHEDGDD